MRPQKPKNKNRKIQNRWKGYFLDDIACKHCTNFRGTKRGCVLKECDFKEEKLDAIKHSRIRRKGGDAV